MLFRSGGLEAIDEEQAAQHVLQTGEQRQLVGLGRLQLQELQPAGQALTQGRPALLKLLQRIKVVGAGQQAVTAEVDEAAVTLAGRGLGQELGLQGSVAADQEEAHSPLNGDLDFTLKAHEQICSAFLAGQVAGSALTLRRAGSADATDGSAFGLMPQVK